MPNRLKGETSPYLLQHQDNPVDWYPWGEEALALAQKLDKPIFLSIGYAACHWCHVMAHESFEDPETAQMMNANFINIKVDREERPDLDTIYMNAVVAMTGQGGWPMSVFLTPDGRPFFGGTYFPPTPRYNIPSFRNVLSSITNAWRTDRDRIEASGAQLYEHIKRELRPETGRSPLNTSGLDQAAMTLAQQYDWSNGGWGQAPKFPQPMVIEYLIRRAVRGDSLAEDLALHAMRSMAQGGMYDVVGGGFHRYSVDNQWLVPHFEKMLYDNAQLAGVYLHGYLLTRDPFFRRVCEETIDFVLREMTHPTGGFYSSLDADSEGEEGRFYVWSYAELLEVISDPADLTLFSTAYTISAEGNFEGNNILQRAKDTPAVADELSLSSADVNRRLDEIKAKLLRVRAGRIRPGTDDKILTSWNGLMLVSLSEGARYLKRGDYLQAARTNARFLLQSLELKNRIYRSWRNGKARYRGYLEDYAALILGLLALYQTDPDPFWFQNAMRLADTMIQRFGDPAGGFFDTGDDHEALLVRPKDIQDNATPSGNALAASALLQLSAFSGDSQIRQLAETALGGVQKLIQRYPTAFGQWCLGLDFATAPVKEVAILWEKETQEIEPFLDPLWAEYRPYHVVAIATAPPPPGSPPLLQNRPLSEGHPTAYVCENFSCLRPTNDPLIFSAQLGSKSQ